VWPPCIVTVAFTIVTNGWQPNSRRLNASTAAVPVQSRAGVPQESKETALGDSYLSGEHGVSASLTARVTKSIDGLSSISKRASEARSLSEPRALPVCKSFVSRIFFVCDPIRACIESISVLLNDGVLTLSNLGGSK